MNFESRALALVIVAGLAACGGRGEPSPDLPPIGAGSVNLADSLVLSAPGGVTVWLTEGRMGNGPGGTTCVERTIEVRQDTLKRKVPLLYTRTAPVLADDTSMVAELSTNCQLFAKYRVAFSDSMPHKLPQ